jgi:hypothetical protein
MHRAKDSNGKVIPSYKRGVMDACKWCLTQINVKALYGMLMRSWAIMGCNEPIIYCNHKNNGEKCDYKFNNLFLDVWYMTKYKYYSMHLHFIYNHRPSWALVIMEF